MGTVLFQDDQDSVLIVSDKSKAAQQKKRKHINGKLRLIGLDPESLSRQNTLQMNKDGFKPIAEEQLRQTEVYSPDPDFKVLPHMKSFNDEVDLHPHVWNALEHLEIEDPTPVQQVAIPYLMKTKSDIIIQAQTGSGKTLLALLPIIDYIIKEKSKLDDCSPNGTSPYAVIIVPTGELVHQLACDAVRLTQQLRRIGVSFARGGLDSRDSVSMIKKGCDILIITPGRLYEYFNKKESHQSPLLNTKNIKFVVLDEVDKLIQPDRQKNKMDLESMQKIIYDFVVNKLTNEDNIDFRAILLSATMNNDFLYKLVVGNYIKINVGSHHPVSTVIQTFVEIRDEHKKLKELMDIINSMAEHHAVKGEKALDGSNKPYQRIGKTIIFVNNKVNADRLAHTLVSQGFNAAAINSDRSTRQRHQCMKDMTTDKLQILVSTDVLSRGMNIPRVEYVINFDHPQNFSSQEYVHRVGRCGRIGNFGRSITFFNPNKDFAAAPSLIKGCEASGQEVPEFLLKCNYYGNNYNQRNLSPPNRNSIRNNSPSDSDSGISTQSHSLNDDSRFYTPDKARFYNY